MVSAVCCMVFDGVLALRNVLCKKQGVLSGGTQPKLPATPIRWHYHTSTATASRRYTVVTPLPQLLQPPDAPISQSRFESPDDRARRARLQRDGIGAKGTFRPLMVIVNPCAQATPALTARCPRVVMPAPCRAPLQHAPGACAVCVACCLGCCSALL